MSGTIISESNNTGSYIATLSPYTAHDTNSTDSSAISLTTALTLISTGGAETRTLGRPTYVGQTKKVVMSVDGGDATITVTGLAAASDVITFANVGEGFTLICTEPGTWVISDLQSAGTLPALA